MRAAATNIDRVQIKDAPLVFLGYGVTAPERKWDDYQGVDMRGKIAIVLVNDPDFETGSGLFGGRAMTYYGRWTYKYEEAARHGALGVLIVHETAPASYGWATVENSNTNAIFDILRTDPRSSHVDVEALDPARRRREPHQAGRPRFRAAQETGAGEYLPRGAAERRHVLRRLQGEARDGRLEKRRRPVARQRRIPTRPVMFTAHWDHLGIGKPDETGDRIFNGAADNAQRHRRAARARAPVRLRRRKRHALRRVPRA